MQVSRTFFFLCLVLSLCNVSCRDTDNKKHLVDEEDGTREINTTELNEMDKRSSAKKVESLDTLSEGEGVYRANDIPQEE